MIYDKKAIYDLLEKSGIRYKIIEHKAMFCEADEDPTLYAEVVPTVSFFRFCKRADLKKIAEELGSTRLGFASEARLTEHLGITPGSVSPFCLLNNESGDVPVYFDNSLKGLKSVGVHPNDNTATVLLSFDDLLKLCTANGNPVHYIDV